MNKEGCICQKRKNTITLMNKKNRFGDLDGLAQIKKWKSGECYLYFKSRVLGRYNKQFFKVSYCPMCGSKLD